MTIRADWTPEEADGIIAEMGELEIPDDYIDLPTARNLMIRYNQVADLLGDALAQAGYHEEQCKYARNNARTMARLRSEAKTASAKDDDAQLNPIYQNAEKRYIMASAYRELLKEKHNSACRSHYVAKTIYEAELKEKGTWAT